MSRVDGLEADEVQTSKAHDVIDKDRSLSYHCDGAGAGAALSVMATLLTVVLVLAWWCWCRRSGARVRQCSRTICEMLKNDM